MFVETFLQKCEDDESTHSVTESKCKIGHDISMFNIFAKNLVVESNSEIHKQRKRVCMADAKKSASARKLKKLTSK